MSYNEPNHLQQISDDMATNEQIKEVISLLKEIKKTLLIIALK
jgi:hypothetical protein